MSNQLPLFSTRCTCRHLIVIICLFVLLIAVPATVLADEPNPDASGAGQCAMCHQTEYEEWQNSPHASAMTPLVHPDGSMECGESTEDCTCLSCHTTNFDPANQTFTHEGVTCEACHGAYVEGHPESGMMQLSVDSSVCSGCHVETHKEWSTTAHAKADVQCIGCHRSHSQDLRLANNQLCESCHRERLQDSGHVVHQQSEVTCVDCHTSPATKVANSGEVVTGEHSSGHTFKVVTDVCANCHGATFHNEDFVSNQQTTAHLASLPECPDDASGELASTKEANKTLQNMTIISLGIGIGVGGMIGIVLALAGTYIIQGRKKSDG